MMNIFIFSLMLLFLLFFMMVLLYLMSMKSMMDREKSSPFECGFNPFNSARLPFSSHFFLIAVLFLIFDVELVIIMPMMIIFPSIDFVNMYFIMIMFLFILILGLYHEWKNSMLQWV